MVMVMILFCEDLLNVLLVEFAGILWLWLLVISSSSSGPRVERDLAWVVHLGQM